MLKVVKGFTSAGEDLNSLSRRLAKNQDLLKLLYFSSADPMSEPDLKGAELETAFNKCIRLVPKMVFDENKISSIFLTMDLFRPSANPAYRSNRIVVDILVPLESWVFANGTLRPFKIMEEIEKEIADQTLNGIGRVEFQGADLILIGQELAGYSMIFETVNDR